MVGERNIPFSIEGEDLRDQGIPPLKNKLMLYTNSYYSDYKNKSRVKLKPITHDAYHDPHIFGRKESNEVYGIGDVYGEWPLHMNSEDGVKWKVVCEYELGGNASQSDMVLVADTICIYVFV